MKKQHQLVFYTSELKQCRYILNNRDIENKIATFLLKYVSIEAFYKKLLIAEREKNGNKLTKKDKKNLHVFSSDVQRVLDYFEIEYDTNLIERIFGSNDSNYMDCSIKKLRDRMVHNVNDNVLRVILVRLDTINKDLDDFLLLFSNEPNKRGN